MATADNGTSTKRRFRFRLRSLIVAMVLVSLLLAMLAGPVAEQRRQSRLVDLARERGVIVTVGMSFPQPPSLARYILSWFDASYSRFASYQLDFSGAQISDDDLSDFGELQHVFLLDLSGTQVTDDSLSQIVESMPYLAQLDLSGTRVTDEGISQLSGIKSLGSLQVANTQVSDAALEKLEAESPLVFFREERIVEQLQAAGVTVICDNRYIPVENPFSNYSSGGKVAVHVLVGSTVSDKQLQQIGQLRSVRRLHLHPVTVRPEGLATLGQMPELKTLSVFITNLTDANMEALARQTQLEELSFMGNIAITDKGLAHLKSLTNLKKLQGPSCPKVTDQALADLAETLPNCECTFPGRGAVANR